MAAEDAWKLGVSAGDLVVPRAKPVDSAGGSERTASSPASCRAAGRRSTSLISAGVLIPAGRLDASGVPDYNAIVEVLTAPA